MNETPSLISAIIPVLNGEAYLQQAVQSILQQTWPNTEIIVIDGGSSDGTANLVKQHLPHVRYFYQENAGIGAARNHGIAQSKGEYIAFLDADDYWLKHKLQQQMQVFVNKPDTEMVFGHIKQFHSPELSQEERDRLHCPDELMSAELPSTLLCRPEVFARVGPFETRWKVGQDVSWIMRARELKIRAVVIPELVYMRRLHNNNNGNTKSEDFGDRLKIIKAMLDRRRAKVVRLPQEKL